MIFDGIVELDNPTPAWFMGLFYATIIFAVVYLLNYHVFEWSPLQDEEYAIEMKAAEVDKAAVLAKSGEAIDENSVKLSTDAGIIAAGKAVYTQNCIACHGALGEGTVGPNLTDDSWIHGGTVNAIFKTIKYGVPEKGMISWEKTLTPKQTSDVSNFILSLQGTNPPNPKAPQGVKL
jgi:cytochrome c oxidase cbb3-type subunit 3